MINSWETEIIIYIFKNGLGALLINSRLIALLSSIYKIWGTIITNRLTPIMNMLTDERQHAYQSNKSTIDFIYNIKRNLIKTTAMGTYYSTFLKHLAELTGRGYATFYMKKASP